jgi:predicted CXXCH cytochrome family protein
MGKPHFEIAGCLNCHKNPHTPLNISFASNVTDACLSCHTQQIAQLRDNKSKHTNLNCSTCHSVHKKVPQCNQCHKPHSAEMAAGDCRKCHKAHMPKVVTYAANTPSKDCSACHRRPSTSQRQSVVPRLLHVPCHQERHKMIPNCQDCHGSPHPAGIMAKFQKCGECHNIAHDLNNWPVTKKEAPKEAPKKKK